MQAGFAMLELGSVRAKNAQNILLKNLLASPLTTILWWTWGFAFAFGTDAGLFIGTSKFFGTGLEAGDETNYFFQWAFASTASTIVSGCLAERVQLKAFIWAVLVLSTFV